MPEQERASHKLSSDPLFWIGIFLAPLLICLAFSMGDSLVRSNLPVFFYIVLVIAVFGGAFYSGFKLGWRCVQKTAFRVALSLLFVLGFLFVDFVFFFIGCCASLKI